MAPLSFKRNLAWMGGGSLLGQVITWSITILVARRLLPGDYGLVALSGLFTVFAISISEMGVGAAVIQRDEITETQVRSLYTFSILVGIIMTLIGMLVAPFLGMFFDETRLIALTRFQSLIFLISALKSMQRTLLVRETRFDTIAKIETSSRVLTSFCTLGLVYCGAGVWALAAQWLFIEFFQLVGFGSIRRLRPAFRIDFKQIQDVLSFGVGVMCRNMTYKLYDMADVTILGRYASKEFLGAYTFSKQLTNMPFEKILTLVNQVLFPYLAKENKNIAKIRKWTLLFAEIEACTLIPFFIMLFFCADETVYILLGSAWTKAVLPMRVFCVANIFKLAENYNSTVLTALGEIRVQVKFSFIQLLGIVAGMLIISSQWNPEGAMYVWITLYPLIVILFSKFMLVKVGLSYKVVFDHLKIIVVCHSFMIVSLYGVTSFLQSSIWLSLIMKLIVGAGTFLLSLFILDREKMLEIIFLVLKRKG